MAAAINQWMLLADVRRRLLPWWLALSALILALLLVQTLFGKYAGIEGQVWFWGSFLLLPGLLLLLLSAWLNKHSARIVAPSAYRALWGLTLLFLLLTLGTLLLAQLAIEKNDYGLDTWLRKSYAWLAPLNILLCTGLVLLFYRRQELFQPGSEVMIRLAGEKAHRARHPVAAQVFESLAQNNLDLAFDRLQRHFEACSVPDLHHILVLRNEYRNLVRARQSDIIDPEKAQRQLNRLTLSLLEITDSIS
jgi:hypothetical protein